MARVHLIATARPNLMKTVPVGPALRRDNRFGVTIVDTGQHDGPTISAAYLRDPELSEWHRGLEMGSTSNAEQIADASVAHRRAVAAACFALALRRRGPVLDPGVSQPA